MVMETDQQFPQDTGSTNDVVVSVNTAGKLYQLFDHPQDRLKHMLLWRFGKTYGHPFWALRNVTFELHRGEMLAIIGKNGSGKSTLLQMITGILTPTEGTIQVNGRIGALLELGSGFNPEYTGRENIQLNAAILGITAEELKQATQSIIEFADIGEFIDQPVKLYSSGMFVRLAFAVTTGLNSDILLIDEALAVGDVFFRQKCYQRLAEMRRRGVSIILVTHSMGDVEQHCERAVLLHHGMELFQGPAPEAVKRYYLVEQEDRVVQQAQTSPSPSDLSPPIAESLASDGTSSSLSAEAFFDLTQTAQVTNGWARCIRVALCDEHDQPCRVFEQGEVANFYFEFEILHDIEVPIGGLQLNNEKGIVVHGKTTLEYGTEVPVFLSKGMTIGFNHKINCEIAAGDYTFEVGLSAVSSVDYEKRQVLDYFELTSRQVRLCNVVGLGPISIVFRQNGTPVQLLHHGVANLPGNATVYLR
jgi:lipopolysaccharide transport system ATP-binding protein